MNEKKLKARDFITIGIFTAILWVVQMVIMYLGFLSPFVVAGYAVLIFNLWVSASYLPLILTADSYKQSLIESGFDASFADTLFTLVTPATYPVIILLCFVCGVIGAFIGKAVVRKNFEKAGIV